MPPTLHPHLKRWLDFDEFYTDPEDVIEEIPTHYHDHEERTAKRRRVEIIAAQYLRGKVPVILSAGLRGPFNKGWKNPWAERSLEIPKLSSGDKGMVARRSRPSQRSSAGGMSTAKARKDRKKVADAAQEGARIASPEASRAAKEDLGLETHQRDDSLDAVEVPPATAPSKVDDNASGATEYFSANTEKIIRKRSPLTNPFWLRRPVTEETRNMNQPSNSCTDVSPTRSRSRKGNSQLDVTEGLQIALPKASLHQEGSPARVAMPDECRSSASAAMIISSPMQRSNTWSNTKISLPSSIGGQGHPEIPIAESAVQQEISLHVKLAHCTTPNGEATPEDVRGLKDAEHRIAVLGSQRRPSRKDIQQSADRLVSLMPSSTRRQAYSKNKAVQNRAVRTAPQHNLVASPAPASSTGFIYRKLGVSKHNGRSAQTSKAKVINFEPSPAATNGTIVSDERTLDKTGNTPNPESCTIFTHQLDTAREETAYKLYSGEVAKAHDKDLHEEPDQEPSRAHLVSTNSTQAAMLLAQKVFQEGAFSTMSLDTPRQLQHDTPRPLLPDPSPAITPLPGFDGQLDKVLPDASVLRGPPISTQDLFGATSPFAFSTVKKKPEISQRSSLRFALLQTDDEQSKTSAAHAKSPTPSAERVPLKDKNTTTAFWSFVTEKASQASQESSVGRTRRSIGDVGLPQLDFHTSLDDFGPNGDLHFTDRFLRNLDGP
ncbi:hypothetical protein N0V83_007194 [Neocucurbitaria cava]|uniref:Uncharacterized protein n=1 Tax=Neocucurbitaria cava TaxID=798079 RepID=A0A9W8Y4M9_9PLEO|nr:hypothetical protein N0V83_007194 [Neocucurbitaria cava]